MAVFAVTTTIPTEKGFVWFPFETELETLEDLKRVLIRDRVVIGVKYQTGNRRRETVKVIKKQQILLGIGMVGTIAPMHIELDDDDENGGADPRT